MASGEAVTSVDSVVSSVIGELLQRREGTATVIRPEADLFTDLSMDSLELAELSAALEDSFGRDPFSGDQLPQTVGELVEFYSAS